MDAEAEDASILEEDYYTFLNVPRDASTEEITNAYRKMSRFYHPDKHVEPADKKEADIVFSKIKKAYEILKDDHKRAIYDSLGVKGLETDGWEIIQRTKTPGEIREEYERLAKQREERRLRQRTNAKGNVSVHVNATDLFNEYDDEYDYELHDGFPTIEVSGMSIQQSIEAPLTSCDTATISGQLSNHNGTGSGTVTVSNRRQLSEKGWVEMSGGAGSGPVFGLKGFRNLGKRSFVQCDSFLQFTNSGVRTGLDTVLAMQLEKSTIGYLTWRTGSMSGISSSIIRDTQRTHFNATIMLGVPHSYVSLAFIWKFKEQELKLKSLVKAGTFGSAVELGAEKKVSEQSTVSATVVVGVPSGVALRLRFTRASQSYLFPIQLCDDVMPSPVFYATVTPLITYIIVKKLVMDPIANEQASAKRQRQKDTYRNRMAEKRREAMAATSLMSNTFARIRGEEEVRKGLVIVSAEYGKLSSDGSSGVADSSTLGLESEVIDVTVPLQCLVKDSKLVIHSSSKSQLPGFYDPCVGEDKSLRVQYLFHSQLHQTTINDNESLRIPRQSHRVNPS